MAKNASCRIDSQRVEGLSSSSLAYEDFTPPLLATVSVLMREH